MPILFRQETAPGSTPVVQQAPVILRPHDEHDLPGKNLLGKEAFNAPYLWQNSWVVPAAQL
jgi:hypothetical protein